MSGASGPADTATPAGADASIPTQRATAAGRRDGVRDEPDDAPRRGSPERASGSPPSAGEAPIAELASADDGRYDDPFDADATLALESFSPEELSIHAEAPFAEGESPLFRPVDRQDDLQRIFGIGPVTERQLNALGITSYSQLAELESHEIEKIADALQIGPERIEEDDWVGSARRQLEDVLEQL